MTMEVVKLKEHFVILFAQNIIEKNEPNTLINILIEITRNNNLLKGRILLPFIVIDEQM